MEKGHRNRRRKKIDLINLLFCGLLYGVSNQIVVCQNINDYIGRYKYTVQDIPWDTTILELHTDGRFEYIPYSVVSISMPNCDTIKGNWTIKNKTIILNSDFQTKDYIKILSKNEHKDSVKIRLVRFPSGLPSSNTEEIFVDKSGNRFFIETDDNGIVIVPRGYNIVLFPFSFNLPKIPKLKGGCYYQFTEVDCLPEIFENRKMKIQGDTLIMITKHKLRGRKNGQKREYYIFKDKYIKIQNEHYNGPQNLDNGHL